MTVNIPSKETKHFERHTLSIEAPYNTEFDVIHVYVDRRSPPVRRSFVYMYKAGNSTSNLSTLYSRYLFQVAYWKEHGQWIPDDMEVDHINNNPYDDRLENLQLLTYLENVQKRDEFNYGSKPVNQIMLDKIDFILGCGKTRSEVIKTLKITYGYLRYLIHKYLPVYENTTYVERNTDDIIDLLGKGCTAADIGEQYGVSKTTILRLYEKVTGRKYSEHTTSERVKLIKQYIEEGMTLGQISKEFGVTEGAVLYLVKKYLPAMWKTMKKNYTDTAHYGSEFKNQKLDEIEALLNEGYSLTKAAEKVGIKQQQASAWLAELRPALREKMRQTRSYRLTEEQKRAMVEDYIEGATFSVLAVKYQVSTATVHKFCTEAGVVRAPRLTKNALGE